jgi:hypothetical protein
MRRIDGAGIQYRFLHTSPFLKEKAASSKVEETVNRLKERQKETLENISKVSLPTINQSRTVPTVHAPFRHQPVPCG